MSNKIIQPGKIGNIIHIVVGPAGDVTIHASANVSMLPDGRPYGGVPMDPLILSGTLASILSKTLEEYCVKREGKAVKMGPYDPSKRTNEESTEEKSDAPKAEGKSTNTDN